MKKDLFKLRKLNINDLDDMLFIFKQNYIREQHAHESFVSFDDIKEETKLRLTHMLDHHSGFAVTLDNHLIGYLIGFETGPLFGEDLGVVVPLHGHGSIIEKQKMIYQLLFEHAALYWTKNKIFSIAITMFAHDEKLKQFWFENGFGMRCVDGIRHLDDMKMTNNNIIIKEIKENDIDDLFDLHHKHNLSYRRSPLFMPNADEDPKADLLSWLNGQYRYIFGAYLNKIPVGYMRIEETGESVISHAASMMNITGAYVDPNYRDQMIGSELLRYINTWTKNHQYHFLGVDYESINPEANHFWKKYFKPYTVSLTRRIDENIYKYL